MKCVWFGHTVHGTLCAHDVHKYESYIGLVHTTITKTSYWRISWWLGNISTICCYYCRCWWFFFLFTLFFPLVLEACFLVFAIELGDFTAARAFISFVLRFAFQQFRSSFCPHTHCVSVCVHIMWNLIHDKSLIYMAHVPTNRLWVLSCLPIFVFFVYFSYAWMCSVEENVRNVNTMLYCV